MFVCWNVATLLGALAGSVLSDPRTLGLDAAAPAAFLALLAPRVGGAKRIAGLAAAAALIAVPLVPAGVPVLIAAAVATGAALVRRRRTCGRAARRGRGALMWTAILIAAGGCYALKLAGLSLPRRVLDAPRAARVAAVLPVALLAALIATNTFSAGRHLTLDARAAGLAAAVVALRLRAPFLVVVASASATAAVLRLLI